MNNREIGRYGLSCLIKAGADKAQCVLAKSEKRELNVEAGKFSLIRTTYDSNMNYKAIKDNREGITRSNKTDKDSIEQAAADALEIATSSQFDNAYDIAEKQESKRFYSGSKEPDIDRMFNRLQTFVESVKEKYPKTILELAILDFTHLNSYFMNSNGVDFTTSKGIYNFIAMFTSKDEERTSSFNYSGFSTRELEKEFLDYGTINLLLKQSSEQLELNAVNEKFTGDIIITPDSLAEFIDYFTGIFLRDVPIISGTSVFKDKLNEQVADSGFTLYSRPISGEIADNYFVTPDGFEAKDSTIIEKGVLKSFLLSLYGANKTVRERAVNSGNVYVVDPGDQSFDDMVKSVKRGLLLCRFSGGYPNDNGDFSGVAKNSYYIEDGEIKYPTNETMISGNLTELFMNIKSISKERVNYGDKILPWLLTSGITISGK